MALCLTYGCKPKGWETNTCCDKDKGKNYRMKTGESVKNILN